MKQMYTSKNTSINSKKMPKIYGLIADLIGDKTVIDYGCGKYFDNYGLPENYYGYDPYNRPDEDALTKQYDVALCSNVLNVIMEPEVREQVMNKLKELAKTIYITVYEGNKSGVGKMSKDDCYQLNRKIGDYIPELVSVFGAGNVTYNRKGYFECKGGVV